MSLVATLVSSRTDPQVSAARAEQAARAVGSTASRWLMPSVALDLSIDPGLDAGEARRRLADALEGAPVDIAVLPMEGRRKAVLVADMDSTMIGQECIDELADMVGLRDHVSAITERAMRGELAFEPALRERVALLRDLPLATVEAVIAERITLTPGALELVRTMRADGALTALVSGGFTLFTRHVAAAIGFSENRANELGLAGDRLDGTVAEPILGREAKREALCDCAARRGVDLAQTMAVGDGANDLAMITAAGLGVAYHAKPKVAAEAAVSIAHADLTALLFVQGYAAADITTAV